MTKIALIEVTHFHDECLFSQIRFLKHKDHHITLICNILLKDRVKMYNNVDEFVYIDTSSKFKKYKSWFKILRYVTKNNISKVIFNTAENHIYKLLLLPFPRKTELIGTIHNANKLVNRKQKKISRKIHKYLTLSDLTKEQILREKLTNNPVSSYYPIFFPEYENKIKKAKNEIWVTIPEAIDFKKRDYSILKELKIPDHFKIILLGKADSIDAKNLLKTLKQSKYASNYMFFDGFIDVHIFHSYIKQSDFILPLITPFNMHFEKFLKYKITGSYNLAFGYKIPLILEKSFSNIGDFQKNTVFYDYKKIDTFFNLIQKSYKPHEYKLPSKFTFNFQKQQYLNFLNLTKK